MKFSAKTVFAGGEGSVKNSYKGTPRGMKNNRKAKRRKMLEEEARKLRLKRERLEQNYEDFAFEDYEV